MSNLEITNHKYCQDTLKWKQDIEKSFLVLGERLYKIKQGRKYEAGWDSWEEYEMELGLSSSTVSKLLNIYQKFMLEYEFSAQKIVDAGGWTKVALLLPVVSSKKSAKEWLHTASNNTYRDLGYSIKEARTGKLIKDCKHKETYTIRICTDCGDRERIYD